MEDASKKSNKPIIRHTGMPNNPISEEKQLAIQKLYDDGISYTNIGILLSINYRTVKKYVIPRPKTIISDQRVANVYMLVGCLTRAADILDISQTTVWRRLKKQNIQVGGGASSWKRLYATLRARATRSTWRKTILDRDNRLCVECGQQSNIVHHIMTLADIRDNVIRSNPGINPFNSFSELRQFTDIVMSAHLVENGIVLCRDCHEDKHYK